MFDLGVFKPPDRNPGHDRNLVFSGECLHDTTGTRLDEFSAEKGVISPRPNLLSLLLEIVTDFGLFRLKKCESTVIIGPFIRNKISRDLHKTRLK